MRCDVAVVGAGPAGLAAAAAAAEAGRAVALIDEQPRGGGQIWRHADTAPAAAVPWLRRVQAAGVTTMFGHGVFDIDAAARRLTLSPVSGGGAVHIDAAAIVLATGARELFVPLPGWTAPGVFGVGGLQALLKSGLDVSGQRVVLAGSGPLLLPVAASLAAAGADVVRVVEQAPRLRVAQFAASLLRTPGRLTDALRYRRAFDAPYDFGVWPVRVHGKQRVEGVTLTDGRREWFEPCTLVGLGFGLVPATETARLVGCAHDGDRVVVDEYQRTSVTGVWAAGEPTGIAGAEAATVEGEIAGLDAAGSRIPGRLLRRGARGAGFARHLAAAFALRPELRALAQGDTIVCRCESVAFSAIRSRAGARDAKLATRAGMGACQGRVCGPALHYLLGWPPDTVRPPLLPADVGALMDIGASEPAPGERG